MEADKKVVSDLKYYNTNVSNQRESGEKAPDSLRT